MESIGTWWMWLGFLFFILVVLALDTFLLGGGKSRKVSVRTALRWTLIWIACALIFDGLLGEYLYYTATPELAKQKTLEFFTGFVIEKSLSADNLFVFFMIFAHFKVPPEYQRRILHYGILGAIILRFVMIALGTSLVAEFHWILYLFGLFLVLTSLKMLCMNVEEKDFSESFIFRWLQRHLRLTSEERGGEFFIRQKGVLYATRLFLVLILIEISDVIFALDSIPAIFAITQDAFIVFTSNIFAILGLRALYFLLADMAERFHLLKYGIALLLAFVGIKMLIEPWLIIPTPIALAAVVAILATTVILSFLIPERK